MDEPTSPRAPGAPLTVVGLGASTGGIDALRRVFATVMPPSGSAYVVLHVASAQDERIAQALQDVTALPVHEVRGRMTLEPDQVYVSPAGEPLEFDGADVLPGAAAAPAYRRSPIDTFLRALAQAHGGRAVAVILSGVGPQGSAGLKRVKEYGGLVVVQDPLDAQSAEMPRHAIATGLVDLVRPAGGVGREIAAYHAMLTRELDESGGTIAQAEALREVLSLLRVRTGQDFANYKRATVFRRIERRMNVRGMATMADYVRLMREQPDEATALMKDLLISVTSFFRDRDAFALLESRVIPELLAHKHEHEQVRIWSAGCATGEEAYSIAMLCAEAAERTSEGPAIQVFATDLDENAIAIARDGFYSAADVADVPEERLQRFFQREGGGYRVRRDLREMVLFARHNVIKDPSFSHLDLVSCRNLLIYLDRHAQERVIETFHFALRPDGYLLLGMSESPDAAVNLFTIVDKTLHLYQSRPVTSRPIVPIREPAAVTVARPLAPRPDGIARERLLPADLHQRLLEEYAPPSIIANPEGMVLHVSERAGRYLQVGGGEPSRELLRMVHPDLAIELRTALLQAVRERQPVHAPAVPMRSGGTEIRVSLTVRPVLRDQEPGVGVCLVFFEEVTDASPGADAMPVVHPPEPLTRQLEEELARVRSQLHATVQQYETQVEEARAANEELQAMNEELRSAAEELETSKEELQSVNEELTTVNQELKIKIEELGLTNNDFQNLMNSTEIGTIFLDRAFRVKLSTPRVQDVFNLLPSDLGRPLSDITSRLRDDTLHDDVRVVLERLQTIEREVQTREGRWYLMRVLPYRTTEDRIDGVVVTFQDISTRRQAEQRLRLLIDSATDYAIFTMTVDGIVDSWNVGAERLFGYHADEIIGRSAAVLFTPEDRDAGIFDIERRTALETGRAADARWHVRKNGTRLYCSGVTTRLGDAGDAGLAKICRDLTVAREAEVSLQQARNDLEFNIRARTSELQAEVAQHAAAEERISQLLRRVVTTQEDERRRIARDLHDQLGQQLTALRLALDRVAADGNTPDVERAQALAREIDAELDFLAWELRPTVLDDLGLGPALPRYVAEWSAHFGIPAECRADGYTAGALPPEVEVAFYRVAQEALNNVARHADASRVDVLLDVRDGQVVLVVEDDGVGFVPTEATRDGLGLVGMRERAALAHATLEIESAPDRGTSIYLRRGAQRGAPQSTSAASEPSSDGHA